MADDTTSGVIHDIGFRHYTGPRLGRAWAVRSLLVETLRGVYGLGRPSKVKVMPWVLVGIFALPALVIGILLILLKLGDLPWTYAGYPAGMALILTLFVAGRAPYAVSGDLRDGVMPLYLSRPVKSSDYVLAKFWGLALGLFLFTLLPETLLLIGALLGKLPIGANILGWLGGLIVAAVLAVVLSAIGLAIASITPRRGIGVAAIVTTLILAGGFAAILHETLNRKGSGEAAAYVTAINPYGLANSISVSWLGVDGARAPAGWLGALFLLVVFVTVVGGCLAFLVRRYRKVGGL